MFNKVLLGFVNTGKSRQSGKHKIQVFKVSKSASKNQIIAALHDIFSTDLEILSIRTCIVKPKPCKFRKTNGVRNSYKKAYVTTSRTWAQQTATS